MTFPTGAPKATRATERKAVEPRTAERPERVRAPMEPALPGAGEGSREVVVASKPPAQAVANEARVVAEVPPARPEPSIDAPADEEVDLEVPSFLRRKRPPSPGAS
jgi:hypothetical protein